MKKIYFLLFTLVLTCSLSAQSVFINEIHYDNGGGDVNEAVEIAGPAGTDLTGWTVEFYNGSNGTLYDTITLSGTIDDEGAGFGAVSFAGPSGGIQNGAPDGLALIDNGTVIQFLSYEGSLTAISGAAIGMTSTDIGVSESGTTPVGESLQLTNGPGTDYSDFTWTGPIAETPGTLNVGQIFTLSVPQNEITEFSIFPNPTNTGFVNINTTSNEAINATVFDVLGKQVLSQTVNDRLNVSNLNAGVYILHLNQNGATTTKKLVIK
ncbi:T9SS type A sorting domain-containing protein [Lacinutrix chionoecetis]